MKVCDITRKYKKLLGAQRSRYGLFFAICNLQLCLSRDMKDLSINYTLTLVNYSVFFVNLGLQWVLNPEPEETTMRQLRLRTALHVNIDKIEWAKVRLIEIGT